LNSRHAINPGGRTVARMPHCARRARSAVDELAAVHAGRIRAYLEPRGIKIGPMDTLLAAHALSIGATVVTGNMREFARVPGFAAENWLR
jgi:tRNA(fMet)-specific endonuclease VapC